MYLFSFDPETKSCYSFKYKEYFFIKEGERKPEMPQGTFFKPKFFDFMKEEYIACREGVGIIDMSSFSKIEIKVSTLLNNNLQPL